jgi:hypothetical protein
MPEEDEFTQQAPPDAVSARRSAAHGSDYDGRLCNWQEPDRWPPPKPSPHRKQAATAVQKTEYVSPATSAAAKVPNKQATQAAPLPDRTPFHWGFFGAETR